MPQMEYKILENTSYNLLTKAMDIRRQCTTAIIHTHENHQVSSSGGN